MRNDLAKIRERGYAVAVEEAEPGITAVACSIIDPVSGTALGTISVAGPSFRFPAERYGPLSLELNKAATQIARILPNRTHYAAKKVVKHV